MLANRQSFLEQIAREAGIDPMNALDWKNVSLQFITSKKVNQWLKTFVILTNSITFCREEDCLHIITPICVLLWRIPFPICVSIMVMSFC